MRIDYTCNKGHLKLYLYPDPDEFQGKKATLHTTQCEFQLPEDWSPTQLHPDAFAFALILLVYPFSKQKISLPFGISPFFAQTCKTILKKEVNPIDSTLQPRESKPSYKLGLAYSGGVDSTAALLLSPKDTCLFFIDRMITPNTTLYTKEAALFACNTLKQKGYQLYTIPTNFEYLRSPIGFPVDLACCVPIILMSDYIGIDSVSAGLILESAYGIGHEHYKDYPRQWHYKVWGTMFQSIDLPLSLTVAGLSEVATTFIVSQSDLANIADSCMRGQVGNPCMQCMKCFRKKLLEETLANQTPSDSSILQFFSNSKVHPIILQSPIRHQDVLMYITNHYHGTYPPMLAFKKKMGDELFNVNHLIKWYSPSLEVISPKYQSYLVSQINTFVSTMSDEEIRLIESWDLQSYLESESYKQRSMLLASLL